MKTIVKFSTIMLALAIGISACGPVATATVAPATSEPATAVPATEIPPVATTPAAVTIRYAAWNLGAEADNNIARQMIKAYTDAHPWVTIEFVDMSAPGGWDAVLTGYAAKNELPDVFYSNNTSLYIQNGWLADNTDTVAADPDWASVPEYLKNAMTFDGKVVGLPADQFLMGYWVNTDLYDAANLDAPYYGMPVEEFFQDAKALTNIPKGILGLDEAYMIQGWYPSTVDPSMKYYSYDGINMNYNSEAFKEGVAKNSEMIPYMWQGLTDEQKVNFKSVGPWELFSKQEVGVRWDASWNVPDWQKNLTFNWDFVGIPGGNQCMVIDRIVISKTAANYQEAYNFAKWMTFGSDAYAKEVELYTAMGQAPLIPVSMTDASLALYKTHVDKPGINAALANMGNSLVESLAGYVPGYIQARWEGKPGIDIGDNKDVSIGWLLDNTWTGLFKFEDYSAQLEVYANRLLSEARAAMPK